MADILTRIVADTESTATHLSWVQIGCMLRELAGGKVNQAGIKTNLSLSTAEVNDLATIVTKIGAATYTAEEVTDIFAQVEWGLIGTTAAYTRLEL